MQAFCDAMTQGEGSRQSRLFDREQFDRCCGAFSFLREVSGD
jgi:hypothetical protein